MTDTSRYIRLRCVEHGDCLRWYTKARSEGRKRHPMFKLDGVPVLARRALYEAERGRIPDGHSLTPCCGDDYCIEPLHQKLIDAKQKSLLGAKAARHSPTRGAKVRASRLANGLAMLTPELARSIRASDETCVAVAARLGVSVKAVSDCRLHKTWPEANPFGGLA